MSQRHFFFSFIEKELTSYKLHKKYVYLILGNIFFLTRDSFKMVIMDQTNFIRHSVR